MMAIPEPATAPLTPHRKFARAIATYEAERRPAIAGRLTRVIGHTLRADLPGAGVGDVCQIRLPGEAPVGLAEVVALDESGATLLPYGSPMGLTRHHEVVWHSGGNTVAVGDGLLGAVLDGMGHRLDTDGSPEAVMQAAAVLETVSILQDAPAPLDRPRVSRPIVTGIRTVDGLLTLGEGQRIGIFAAAGIGKTSLLGMFLRGADVDVCVIALIGERGREVNEFIELELSPEARARTVLVVSTSDRPAVERRRAAYAATAIAEHFRARGKRVLLVMDSLTRFARAAREIGLASGEPPVRRGFPPSVFTALPQLLERAGNTHAGSITAIYTVLVEGDDLNEPIADEARSLLDGHIVLSAKLAAEGRFPAIDVLTSASRVMHRVADDERLALGRRMRALLTKYREIELLVSLGEYQRGNDMLGDEALDRIEAIRNFLAQDLRQIVSVNETVQAMRRVFT